MAAILKVALFIYKENITALNERKQIIQLRPEWRFSLYVLVDEL